MVCLNCKKIKKNYSLDIENEKLINHLIIIKEIKFENTLTDLILYCDSCHHYYYIEKIIENEPGKNLNLIKIKSISKKRYLEINKLFK